MKLLKDECLFCIKVDYFMINGETNEEYTQPEYLGIDTKTKKKDGTPANFIIFLETITENLRVFDTEREALDYMNSRIKNPCYCENPRVIKIKYNFENNKWEEVQNEEIN